MGLGSYPLTSLAEARERRDKWRKVLMDGRNPIEVRRSGTGKAGQTFGLCVAEFPATKSPQRDVPVIVEIGGAALLALSL